MKSKSLMFFFLLVFGIIGCQEAPPEELPIIGRTQIIDGDTVTHKIRDFKFINQDGQSITNETFKDQLYIADFFFTSCPTICPRVTKQMLRIHDHFRDTDKIQLVSYTIDPKRDDTTRLKKYADNLGVNADKWHFLTGDQDSLLDIADDYFVVAYEDADTPGGFDHSGKILLVDRDRQVRAFAEGTEPESVTKFIKTVEQFSNSLIKK